MFIFKGGVIIRSTNTPQQLLSFFNCEKVVVVCGLHDYCHLAISYESVSSPKYILLQKHL